MTCQELASYLDAYLDDELSVTETLRVQGHLAICRVCRGIVNSEAKLRQLVEADAVEDRAPEELRRRVLRQVAQASRGQVEVPPPSWTFRAPALLVGALAAGVALAGLFAVWACVRAAPNPVVSPLTADVASKHLAFSGREDALQLQTPDSDRAAAWLRERLTFPVKLPPFARPGERLLGARASSVADSPAAYLLYERDGRRTSLFIFREVPGLAGASATRWVEGVRFYTSSLQGTPVVWWEDAEVYYAAASDTGTQDLTEFGLLCVRGKVSPAGESRAPPGPGARRAG